VLVKKVEIMYEAGINTADFISTMIFQVVWPIAVLVWIWTKVRVNSGEFRVRKEKERAVRTASRQMVDHYV
jgi:hypothetical protein